MTDDGKSKMMARFNWATLKGKQNFLKRVCKLERVVLLGALAVCGTFTIGGIVIILSMLFGDTEHDQADRALRLKTKNDLALHLQTHPNDADAYYRMSRDLNMDSNFKGQERVLRLAVRYASKNPLYRYEHAVSLANLGMYCDAANEIHTARLLKQSGSSIDYVEYNLKESEAEQYCRESKAHSSLP